MPPAQMMINNLGAKRENAGTKKSPLQIQLLEKFYTEVQYPKPEDMVEYATTVGLTYNQVRIWFKERRRKKRREMETTGARMERQLSSRSSGPRCSSNTSSCNQAPLSESSSISIIGEEHTVRQQVLFHKDYILRKIFRKDGPPLGNEFDPLPQSAHGNIRDATCYDSSQNRRAVNKRKIMEYTDQRSTVPHEDTVPVRKHGIGKGLMTVWHAMYSHNVECQGGSSFIDETGCLRSLRPFDVSDRLEDQDNGKRIQIKSQSQGMPQKKVDKRSKTPLNKRKVIFLAWHREKRVRLLKYSAWWKIFDVLDKTRSQSVAFVDHYFY